MTDGPINASPHIPGDEVTTTELDLLQIIGRELVWKETAQKRYVAAVQAYQQLVADNAAKAVVPEEVEFSETPPTE